MYLVTLTFWNLMENNNEITVMSERKNTKICQLKLQNKNRDRPRTINTKHRNVTTKMDWPK